MFENDSNKNRYRIHVQKGSSLAQRLAEMDEKDSRLWLLTAAHFFHIVTLGQGPKPELVEIFEKGILTAGATMPKSKAARKNSSTKPVIAPIVADQDQNPVRAPDPTASTVSDGTNETAPVVVRRKISLKGVAEGAKRAYQQ